MLRDEDLDRVCVVLVRARNPNNIGAVARAMHDFGFSRLRVVNEFTVPFEAARSAVDASEVMAGAVVYASVAEAVGDCTLVVGTTAVGERDLQHPLRTLDEAGPGICAELRRGDGSGRVALLFGSEKTGLSNEELSHCDWLLTIPMHEYEGVRHPSMNLGQAVAVCLYELVRGSAVSAVPVGGEERGGVPLAAELERLTALLGEVMEKTGYMQHHPANSDAAQVRRLVRRMGADAKDAPVWMGILRQVLWKLRGVGPALVLAWCGLCGSSAAQVGRVYTDADYAQAEKFMQYNVDPLVYHTVQRPVWLGDGRFWYRDVGPDGVTFLLVDPAKGTKGPAFDQGKVAAGLNAAIRSRRLETRLVATLDAGHLPIDDFSMGAGDRSVTLTLGKVLVKCELHGKGECKPAGDALAGRPEEPYDPSPDKRRAAFIRGNNLWVRDVATGRDVQLTTDGAADFGYATDNAGWTHSNNPILVWSPDSKKIATFQLDERKVGRMVLANTTDGHPSLESWRYPLAGDAEVAMLERVVIDVDARKVVRLKMAPDQHRSSLCDDISCAGGHGWDDVQWSADSTRLAFVSTSRDHKQEWLRVADATSGEVREVMYENAPTYFESGNGKVNWSVLWGTDEVLWYSERDDWGQMYLYDLATGTLKSQITHGVGQVMEVLHVDEGARAIYFTAEGKEAGRDPYFAALYRVNLDGSGMKLLTPEDADHAVTASPDGRYFLDVASTPVTPQIAVVRDVEGKTAVELTGQDVTALRAVGWVPPGQITVKARDGKTDLYGLMFKPTSFDAAKRYPIVDLVYPGPQTGSCGSRSFSASHKDMQPLAELGFIVVCIDGMGTAGRSKSFHDAHYGDMGDNTIPDQVAGIKELAARYPWIDAGRVGVYGHSGGGAAAAAAMFHYPDFFKVGVSESGNHDNREYEDDWAEKWQGLLVKNADGTTNYDGQANQNFAGNLKGHLLLVHGTLDDNVPPNNTLLVVNALIKANKDFDLLMIPNVRHAYGTAAPYVTRRRWDYFVRWLAGGVPPAEYRLKGYIEQ